MFHAGVAHVLRGTKTMKLPHRTSRVDGEECYVSFWLSTQNRAYLACSGTEDTERKRRWQPHLTGSGASSGGSSRLTSFSGKVTSQSTDSSEHWVRGVLRYWASE